MADRPQRDEKLAATQAETTDIIPAVTDEDEDLQDLDADASGPDEDSAPDPDAPSVSLGDRITRWGRRTGDWFVPRWPRLLASTVAGALLCASFAPLSWWWAAVLGFVALAWVLTRPATTLAGGFGYGYLAGLVFYIPLLPWISGLVGAFPWLALAAVCALFPALFGLLAVLVRTLPVWPVWFALVWGVSEWLKATIPFGGFPWGIVAFGQTTGPFLPLAQYGGVPLVSVAVALAGFSLAALGQEFVTWWNRGAQRDMVPPAVVAPGVCIVIVLLATALATPAVRQSGAGSGDDPTVTVAAVQGNVPRLGLEFNAQRRAVLDNHVNETLRLARDVREGRAPQPHFVIWPENSSDIDPLANEDARARIDVAARAIGVPILVGGVVVHPDWTPENPAATNTVIVWDPVRGPGERHDKQIVQPFGEYLPWRGFFRLLSSYADRAGYFVPGTGSGVVNAAGVPVGVATCWEVIFDRAVRQSVRNGAQVIAVPTNNATFDATMSAQQLAFARARAVEHDRYVIVAGTTGISAVIAPDGRELARTEFFEPAYLDTQIRLKNSATPATRWGPAIQFVLVAAGAIAALSMLVLRIRQNGGLMRPGRRHRNQPTAKSTGPTTEPKEPHDQ
ncbi:apolipoprotein N-acyltransferase [Mycolicibacterium confluentis]|uniref:Apolipoprotein N-acyltransferase n=1 Tax=Mycolicibacterium confluentis TaxID=28047 RepID=A0A7I7XYA5_9MYCO|nr:apolipoprotein N-acyltransferase [Mycolicibacterium confluentis]MCV7321949.1 apolipoprotein N-acyltransferase [Mycolicibacterium confluentis]BBZ33772.1 apolipoprotein N-acyltransferase [Mycolicibacterium confluentis]